MSNANSGKNTQAVNSNIKNMVTANEDSPGLGKNRSKSNNLKKKTKKEIRNLYEFILYAYSRKGQKLAIKPKSAKLVRENCRMANEDRENALNNAKKDTLLSVPKQILLSLYQDDFTGYQTLHDNILEFVKNILRRHPVFQDDVVQEIFFKGTDGGQVLSGLNAVSKACFSAELTDEDGKSLTPKALDELHRNAVYGFSLWLYQKRYLDSFQQLCRWLNHSLWSTEALKVKSEASRLAEILEIQALAGVGLVCQSFIDEAESGHAAANAAQKEKERILQRLVAKEQELNVLVDELRSSKEHIEKLKNENINLKNAHKDQLAHSLDDHESLRAGFLRRLKADSELLSDGLHALRREDPLIRVMDDHAERVLESMRREIIKLTGEG